MTSLPVKKAAKTKLLILTAAAFLGLAPGASAQKLSFGLDLGMGIPMGDYKDFYTKTGPVRLTAKTFLGSFPYDLPSGSTYAGGNAQTGFTMALSGKLKLFKLLGLQASYRLDVNSFNDDRLKEELAGDPLLGLFVAGGNLTVKSDPWVINSLLVGPVASFQLGNITLDACAQGGFSSVSTYSGTIETSSSVTIESIPLSETAFSYAFSVSGGYVIKDHWIPKITVDYFGTEISGNRAMQVSGLPLDALQIPIPISYVELSSPVTYPVSVLGIKAGIAYRL